MKIVHDSVDAIPTGTATVIGVASVGEECMPATAVAFVGTTITTQERGGVTAVTITTRTIPKHLASLALVGTLITILAIKM